MKIKGRNMILAMGCVMTLAMSSLSTFNIHAEELNFNIVNTEQKPVISSEWKLTKDGVEINTFKSTEGEYKFHLSNLSDGKYTLKEVKNGDGFILNKDEISFEIPYLVNGEKQDIINITPKFNKEQPKEETPVLKSKIVNRKILEKTGIGKVSSIFAIFSGLGLLGLIGYMYASKRKTKEK